MFQHLKDELALFDVEGHWRADLDLEALDVPHGVQLVVGRRVDRLGEASRRVLEAGAIVGRSFSLELLEAIGDVTGEALLTALEEAEAHVLIVPVSTREARWEFSHALIRQTLSAGLSVPRRQRLHLRVAEAIERMSGDAVDTHASDLAHHYDEAGALADRQKTTRYMTVAGDRALETGAFAEASRHFGRAASLLPVEDRSGHIVLLSKYGLARRCDNDWTGAIEHWQRVLSLAEELGDREAVAIACFNTVQIHLWMARGTEAVACTQRGLQIVGPETSHARCRLLAVCGGILYTAAVRSADLVTADAMISESDTIAGTLGDSYDRTEGFVLAAWRHWQTMRFPQQAEAALSGAQLARADGDHWNLCDMLPLVQFASVHLGRLDEMSRFEEEALRLVRRAAHPVTVINEQIARGQRDWLVQADLDQRDVWVQRVVEICTEAHIPWVTIYETWAVLTSLWRGHWEEARDDAEEVAGREIPGVWTGPAWSARFLCECVLGHRDTALALLDERRDLLPIAAQPNTIGAWTVLFGVVEGLAELGERDAAADLYPVVLDAIETGTLVDFDARRLLQTVAGIAAAAGGNWDAAETHYQTALRQAHEIPFRSEQPEVRRWYAQMLLDRNAPGARDTARMQLGEAVEMYRAIGMPRHLALVRGSLESI